MLACPEVRRNHRPSQMGGLKNKYNKEKFLQAPLNPCACDRNRTCSLRGFTQVYFPLRYTDRRHSRILCSACPRRIRRGYNGKRRVIQKPPCFTTGRTMFIMNRLQSNFKIKTKSNIQMNFSSGTPGSRTPFCIRVNYKITIILTL